MIHSLAGELGLDVYIISLSRAGLDDTSLSALISELPERCIALMEDIDAAFNKRVQTSEDGYVILLALSLPTVLINVILNISHR